MSCALRWHGARPQAEVFDAYKRADIFVLASKKAADGDQEGMPNVLQEAGYIEVHKATCASRVRTSLSLTEAGRAAYDGHVAALRSIVGNGGFRGSSRRRGVPAE